MIILAAALIAVGAACALVAEAHRLKGQRDRLATYFPFQDLARPTRTVVLELVAGVALVAACLFVAADIAWVASAVVLMFGPGMALVAFHNHGVITGTRATTQQ